MASLVEERPWHRVWPAHVPRSLDYPHEPAWRLLERNLPRFAHRVALQEIDHESLAAGRSLTYEELWRAVRGVASGLTAAGVERGTRVGLCLPNSAALVIGYYATWVAGGTVVPVNPGAREGEIGAMLSHRNIVVNTTQFAEWYAFAPGDEVSVCALPLFHSGGMSGVMNVPLSAGATLLVFGRFSAAAVAHAVTRHRVTRLFGVPTMFIALLNDPAGRAADYSSLRACRTNAAPLPPSVKAAFDELVGREVLIEGYGLTETSPLTHANPIHRARAGSIGLPLPDTDARIVDESGRDVAPGQPGELLIRGPQVMLGYWNRPTATAEALCDGWLKTGDIARMDDEGYFAIVDRLKDLINTAGFKVWPREVEETIYAHEAVALVMVIGVPDDYRGEAVKACVVLKDGHRGRVREAEIAEFCRARLTPYKVPRIVEFRDALPQTTTGKMLRRLLRESS